MNKEILELKSKGWYQYYSSTHWVHPRIFDYLNKFGGGFFGKDHTNFQYTIAQALEINKKS